jgi:S-adenosyl methyltransferase
VTSGTTPPFGIDTTVPTTARMYDYWLGGTDNFTADRVAALAVSEAAPEARLIAVENRKFLRRAVRYLTAEAGITQFLDIGTAEPGRDPTVLHWPGSHRPWPGPGTLLAPG